MANSKIGHAQSEFSVPHAVEHLANLIPGNRTDVQFYPVVLFWSFIGRILGLFLFHEVPISTTNAELYFVW